MVSIDLHAAGDTWWVGVDSAVELAIPLDFHGEQPGAFSLPPASAQPVKADGFVGDTRHGGSVNCETLELTPHGNGTHTEGVGHVTEQRIPVGDAVPQPLVPAAVLTVSLANIGEIDESYEGDSQPGDRVVSHAGLRQARKRTGVESAFLSAVIIRVESFASASKPVRDHSGTNPPYLTEEATRWLRDVGCEHLLVQLPSIDRERDGGTVPNHHRFFGIEPGEDPCANSRRRTITEMIRVPDSLEDGPYALSLRFPRFVSDAVPSRPVLYPVERQ